MMLMVMAIAVMMIVIVMVTRGTILCQLHEMTVIVKTRSARSEMPVFLVTQVWTEFAERGLSLECRERGSRSTVLHCYVAE